MKVLACRWWENGGERIIEGRNHSAKLISSSRNSFITSRVCCLYTSMVLLEVCAQSQAEMGLTSPRDHASVPTVGLQPNIS